ncbi:DUF6233 domain-containing protein [Streptomyces sp. CA-106131]
MPERPPVDTDACHHREVREGPHLRARSRSDRPASGFVVQQKRTPSRPEPAVIHAYDCTMIAGSTHPIGDHEARVALTDPNVEPCVFLPPGQRAGRTGLEAVHPSRECGVPRSRQSWRVGRLVAWLRSIEVISHSSSAALMRSVGGGRGGCGRFSDRQEAPGGCPYALRQAIVMMAGMRDEVEGLGRESRRGGRCCTSRRTRCGRSAGSSRRAVPNSMTSTLTPSDCTDFTSEGHTSLILRTGKRSCAGPWKP